jgi:spore germination protein
MIIHVVKRGDTLWNISNLYKVSMKQIIEANQLDNPDLLMIGQALVIPVYDKFHIVRPGETLWSISQHYNVSLNDLIRENRIANPNLIFPGQILRIPRPVIEVNGYLTRTGEVGEQIIKNLAQHLTYVSMFSYKVQADGGLTPIDDVSVVKEALNAGVAPLMTITNFTERRFSSELAHTVLSDTEVQDKLLTNILNTMNEKGFKGLNIDFEYVFPEDRELYNKFLEKAANKMHANSYSISTALAPKVKATQEGLLYEAHDYPAHGRLADFVVLMTYEWGWAGGPPMAIAPINSVRQVLDYAVTAIPRSKILMGVPLYGRDWKLPYVRGTSIAETITLNEAIRRAARYRAQILYNDLYQSPYYRYVDENGIEHEVWFEDARSFQAKYNTVKEYGLRGVSYWELGVPAPQNWYVLEHNFRVRKL